MFFLSELVVRDIDNSFTKQAVLLLSLLLWAI
ncbi:hypothetical protein EDC56_1630 [Sinobacterium caligoides]|uniref:Uncharacterized protein n=1 Tax=Sinobacterium caligoides TaxID=933926 RepID=A0A3N2DNE1_9GAMM|nr:hypothetical protein EDC56_1630 [Sinobacterium caligoides]